MKQRYQNEVKFRGGGGMPVEIEYENNKQNIQVLNTERNDITPLLGMDWLKKYKQTIGNIQLDEDSQYEKRNILEKFPGLFENNTTIRDARITYN